MVGSLQTASYQLRCQSGQLSFKAMGDWRLSHIAPLEKPLKAELSALDYTHVCYDFLQMQQLDTAGAYLLALAVHQGPPHQPDKSWQQVGGQASYTTLLELTMMSQVNRQQKPIHTWYELWARIGRSSLRFFSEVYEFFAFLGKFVIASLKLLRHPGRIRWASTIALIEDVGLNAVPIIMMLSFFIGAVIAFMGANLLDDFGVQIFMVDLVGFSVLREFACLISAIMLAGRSDSAFTAQIGAMKMRQEIDAMNVIGLDTYETLIMPRAIACLIATPILTFLAMLSGLTGGMLVAWLGPTEISPLLFFVRLRDVVPIENFWVGMVKTPFFAIVIALIGCRQGLAVSGSVDSLGQRTTTSVVQAIFSVIVIDALFAMLFLELGV